VAHRGSKVGRVVISNVHKHDHPVHISNRTYLQDSPLRQPTRHCPMVHGKLGFHRPDGQLQGQTRYPDRFRSGFARSLMIQKFGRLCTRMHASFFPLDHFPPSLSSVYSCSRHNWPSRGRRSLYELCHASVSPLMDGSQRIFTLSAGGGSLCANSNCTTGLYCMM
jgi:hypothetical protein